MGLWPKPLDLRLERGFDRPVRRLNGDHARPGIGDTASLTDALDLRTMLPDSFPRLVQSGLDSINKSREVVAAVFLRRKGVERMSRGVGLRPCGRRIRKQTLAHSGPRGSSRRWRARF